MKEEIYEVEIENDIEEEFIVFISHGRSTLWKEVAYFIDKDLEIRTIVLEEQPNRGRTVIEKLEDETEHCDYAIILMTAEDEQKNGRIRARQNVIHEIGFCQAKFGRENVLVLRQNNIEEFSNISGIVYESFKGDNIQSTFERIRKEIKDALERIENEDEEEEEEEYEEEGIIDQVLDKFGFD